MNLELKKFNIETKAKQVYRNFKKGIEQLENFILLRAITKCFWFFLKHECK